MNIFDRFIKNTNGFYSISRIFTTSSFDLGFCLWYEMSHRASGARKVYYSIPFNRVCSGLEHNPIFWYVETIWKTH